MPQFSKAKTLYMYNLSSLMNLYICLQNKRANTVWPFCPLDMFLLSQCYKAYMCFTKFRIRNLCSSKEDWAIRPKDIWLSLVTLHVNHVNQLIFESNDGLDRTMGQSNEKKEKKEKKRRRGGGGCYCLSCRCCRSKI